MIIITPTIPPTLIIRKTDTQIQESEDGDNAKI